MYLVPTMTHSVMEWKNMGFGVWQDAFSIPSVSLTSLELLAK